MTARVSAQIGREPLSFETGLLARQANGSVVVRQGDTVVLVTACASAKPTDRIDIVPLTCDYRERSYAAGKIPGGFFKREGRPTEKEILTSRLIDRPIRPLFPKGFAHELQIMATVISADGVYDPDLLALLGASCALRLSTVPFADALGAVRVGYVNGQFVVNPTFQDLQTSTLDIVVAGTKHGITMIEAGIKEVSEEQVLEAIALAYEHIKATIAMQDELVAKAGRAKRTDWTIVKPRPEVLAAVHKAAKTGLAQINQPASKRERSEALAQLLAEITEKLTADETITAQEVAASFEHVEWQETRDIILDKGVRMDGRGFTDLREITCEVGLLPRTHGSGLFTRGETQSLAVTTLGTDRDEQLIEALEGQTYKRFMLHYNFPPFSVNEVRPNRGTGRREIGHGALGERALEPVIPSKDEFPYTIRLVSDILGSNGSSSMATVCAGTLALMDCGVPIKAPVSGVAMGLVTDQKRTAVLTDIAGLEDHIGDMDFKVAGTALGITALQVDLKLEHGLSVDLIRKILSQSHPARMAILAKIAAVIDKPRAQMSPLAPRITRFKINPEKIREVIGPGGRTIRKIIEETGVAIDIEDDGSVSIASSDGIKAQRAIDMVKTLTDDVEVGRIYKGKVRRVTNFGAFCEISPGKEGLVHVSELSDEYVKKIEDVVKVGDEFPVKVIEIDELGRVNLSRKKALTQQ